MSDRAVSYWIGVLVGLIIGCVIGYGLAEAKHETALHLSVGYGEA